MNFKKEKPMGGSEKQEPKLWGMPLSEALEGLEKRKEMLRKRDLQDEQCRDKEKRKLRYNMKESVNTRLIWGKPVKQAIKDMMEWVEERKMRDREFRRKQAMESLKEHEQNNRDERRA